MASKAIPAVMDPSPITAICCLCVSFLYPEATAIPSAAEMEVEECPTPKVSYSLSERLGKPEIPPINRFVWKFSRRPVKILCPYAWCPTSQTN